MRLTECVAGGRVSMVTGRCRGAHERRKNEKFMHTRLCCACSLMKFGAYGKDVAFAFPHSERLCGSLAPSQ